MSETVDHELRALAGSVRSEADTPIGVAEVADVTRRARHQRRRIGLASLAVAGIALVTGAVAVGQTFGGPDASEVQTGDHGLALSRPAPEQPATSPTTGTDAGEGDQATVTAPTTAPADTPTTAAPPPSSPGGGAPPAGPTTPPGGREATAPACTAGGLRLSYDDRGGSGMNQHYATVILTNSSTVACTMPTDLRIEFLASGRPVASAASPTPVMAPFRVEPGTSASFVVRTFNADVACLDGPTTTAGTLRIVLARDLSVAMPTPVPAEFCDDGSNPPLVHRRLEPGAEVP
jgi:hypothetical protein